MNTPVNFELAKMLIRKGIDHKNFYYWNMVNYSGEWKLDTRIWESCCDYYEAPTIADVAMWLYEKHGIWIEVRHIKTFNVNRFHVIIWDYKDTSDYMTIHCDNGVGYEVWDSPTEAYESGIKYSLEYLVV